MGVSYFFDSDSMKNPVCFKSIIAETLGKPQHKKLNYLLYTGIKCINYPKIIKDLNKIFKSFFIIRIKPTNHDDIKLIVISRRLPYKNITIMSMAYKIITTIFRAIDSEFSKAWSRMGLKENSINSLYDMLVIHHLNCRHGHNINDHLDRFVGKAYNKKELIEVGCRYFLEILQEAFGTNFDWDNEKLVYSSVYGQTGSFNFIEKTLRERKS